MSDSVRYQKIMSRSDQERKEKKRKPEKLLRRSLSVIIGLLITVLIIEVIFHFFIAPRIALRNVNLKTDMDISVEEVMSLGNIKIGELFHQINEEEIRRNLSAEPYVKTASVRRVFPDSLNITLRERIALGIVMVNYENVILPALIDEDGVVYRIGYDIRNWELPIIQGIEFNEFRAGAKVEASYFTMLSDIRSLHNDNSELLRAFSEFYVDEVYNGVYEWLLIPVHLPVRVRTSPGLDWEKGMYILKILDVLKQRGVEDITEIDFRAGDVVYNTRGGSDGPQ